MNMQTSLTRLRSGLIAATDSEEIPPAARRQAKSLLERLTSPVRIAVLGYSGSGKSQVLNTLAGFRFLRRPHSTPILELAYGANDRTVISPDGSDDIRVLEGHALDSRIAQHAARLRLETPAEALRHYSLTEVRIAGSAKQQLSTVLHAAGRADILIWCSTEFTKDELALWREVPDNLKDHGFLVLSKVDDLVRAGRLQEVMAALEPVVAEEFHSLLPIAGTQAVASLNSASPRSGGAFAASGGAALVEAIRKHAAQGRQADYDNAWLFVQRYHLAEPDEEDAADLSQDRAEGQDPKPRGNVTPLFSVATEGGETGSGGEDRSGKALLAEASAALREISREIGELAESGNPHWCENALAECVSVVEDLSMRFAELEGLGGGLDEIAEDVSQAVDLLVLLQLEAGEGAVADAVALLLQIRNEMDLKLVA